MVSPRVDDVTLNWTVAGAEIPLVAYSDEMNYRYWLSGISPGGSVNDVVYVWQGKNEKWVKHRMNARSFCRYNGKFYIGGSTSSMTTDIWEYSRDYDTDNGQSIRPYICTPDFIPVSRDRDAKYKTMWVYGEPTTVFADMTIDLYINKNPAAYKTMTVPNDPVTNYEEMFIKKRLNNSIIHDRFRTVSFKISNFTKLYGYDFTFGGYNMGEK